MNRPFVQPARFFLVVTALALCFLALAGRLWQLQVLRQHEYRQLAANSRVRMQVLPAQRGQILDRRGSLLATTRSVVDIGVDPAAVTEADRERIPELAAILQLEPSVIREAFREKYYLLDTDNGPRPDAVRWVELADGVSEETFLAVRDLGMRSVYGNRKHRRIYPAGALAAHVLGFMNEGDYGIGIEHAMHYYLQGQDGWRESERDGRRREIARFRTREVAPRPGFHVELTLDIVIQLFADQAMRDIVEQYDPEAVSILVSDADNGAILAMANYPDFDPNAFHESPLAHYRNRALTDIYEPGSTFKVLPVAWALQEDVVTLDEVIDCGQGVVEMGERRYRLPKEDHPIGEATVAQILYKSSNRGAAQIGLRLGPQRLFAGAQAFGYGRDTGLPLTAELFPLERQDRTGEVWGILKPPAEWDGLTITRLPMGHAVSATPLQVHQAMGVIASGGLRIPPRIVQRVLDQDGQTVLNFPPPQGERVLDTETARELARVLHQVVLPGGTARRANLPGYGVAGKTGTSQKIIDGAYSSTRHVGSFTGFLPVWDPEIVITVVVNDPDMSHNESYDIGYGGLVAAPAFRQIAAQCVQYLGIPSQTDDAALLLALNTDR